MNMDMPGALDQACDMWHVALLTALVLSASCNAASAISTHCVAASMLSRSRAAAYRADPLSPCKPT